MLLSADSFAQKTVEATFTPQNKKAPPAWAPSVSECQFFIIEVSQHLLKACGMGKNVVSGMLPPSRGQL